MLLRRWQTRHESGLRFGGEMVHSVFEAVGTAVVFLCIDPAVSMIGAVGDVIGNIADTLVAGKEAKEKKFQNPVTIFPLAGI